MADLLHRPGPAASAPAPVSAPTASRAPAAVTGSPLIPHTEVGATATPARPVSALSAALAAAARIITSPQ
jgi:hypothetical protein